MRKDITIEAKRDLFLFDPEVVYCQPTHWFGMATQQLKMGILYRREKYDLDHPEIKNDGKKRPCIIFIVGGAWKSLCGAGLMPNYLEFVKAGYVVAFPEYQTVNECTFPKPLEQLKQAVRFLKAHPERWNIDPDRICVMGESAGAQLAALIGLTSNEPEYDKGEYLEQSSSVKAVCAMYAPMEQEGAPIWDAYTGVNPVGATKEQRAFLDTTWTINHVDETAVPFLMLHGTEDQKVSIENSERLYDALEKNGTVVEYYRLVGAQHTDAAFFQDETADLILEFFNRFV